MEMGHTVIVEEVSWCSNSDSLIYHVKNELQSAFWPTSLVDYEKSHSLCFYDKLIKNFHL